MPTAIAEGSTPGTARPPSDGKGARTRQAILQAAVGRFASAGRRGTSVPAIARELGLSPSAVYAYFPTKQALFEAAIDEDAAGLIREALPELLAGSFDRDFTRVFRRLLRLLPTHPLARRILSGEEGCGVERLALLPSEIRLHAGLTEALRAGQMDGTIRSDIDPEVVAMGLETIVVALLVSILQTGGAAPDPAMESGVLAVLDASLRPPA